MSHYYVAPPPAIDGEVAVAEDVNSISEATESAFDLIGADFDAVTEEGTAWASKAKEWAVGPGDPPVAGNQVEPGLYSSRKYSQDAQASATTATGAASTASSAATSATASASSATASASSASTSATTATNAASSATASAASAAASASLLATLSTYLFSVSSDRSLFSGLDSNSNTLAINPGKEIVSLNGQILVYPNDYSRTTTSITLVLAASSGDILHILNLSGIGSVADSLVGIDPILTIRDVESTSSLGRATVRIAESDGSGNLGDYWDIRMDADASSGDALVIRDGTSERVRVASTGSVGIGTTSPRTILDLGTGVAGRSISWHDSSTESRTNIWSSRGGGYTTLGHNVKGSITVDNGFESSYGATSIKGSALELSDNYVTAWFSPSARTIAYGSSETLTPAMRVHAGGAYFSSTGTFTSGTGIQVLPGVSVGTNGTIMVQRNDNHCVQLAKATGWTSGLYNSFYVTGTLVGSITTNGTTTSYNTTSDYRLKEDVQEVQSASERLQKLRPVSFRFTKGSEEAVEGFLAHELQEVIPYAVTGIKDAVDSDGNPEYQTVDYSKVIPLLTAALQEALLRIEELENR